MSIPTPVLHDQGPRVARTLSTLVACATLVCAASWSSPAHASDEPIFLPTIHGETAHRHAKALTEALSHEIESDDRFTLAERDFSLEVLGLTSNCELPPDAACQEKFAERMGAKRYIWGTVAKQAGQVTARVHLWERGGQKAEVTVRYRSDLKHGDDLGLRKVAHRIVQKLLAPDERDRAPEGELYVTAENVSGTLTINGRPAGRIENGYAERMLPPGDYHVLIRAPGYQDVSGRITVTEDGPADLMLSPRKRDIPRDSDDSGPVSNRVAGYGALVVGGALTLAGGYSSWRVHQVNQDEAYRGYREALAKNERACDEAAHGRVIPGQASPSEIDDLCDSAKAFQGMQFVFFGLGGAALAGGVILLLTAKDRTTTPEDTARTSSVRPHVAVGPSSARLDIRLDF